MCTIACILILTGCIGFPYTFTLQNLLQHNGRALYVSSRDLLTCFSWKAPTSFYILPTRGILDPGEMCSVKVIFQPEMALVHDVVAICSFGDTQEKAIKLNAVGKNLSSLEARAHGMKDKCPSKLY